jgi:FixJ family two-component response regulator
MRNAARANAPASKTARSTATPARNASIATDPARHIVLVDDNAAILDSVSMLFRSVGIAVTTFNEPTSFLASPLDNVGCILLDVRLPEMSGMQIFHALQDRNVTTPVIFLTGHGDIPMAVRAMQYGAFDFLEKPFDDQALIESVLAALRRDAEQRRKHSSESDAERRIARLTAREREIADLVVQGMTSREIAEKLSLSLRTIEHYRVKVARKLEVDSVTALVKLLNHRSS